MNRKINTICFIFLFFFLICAVSATEDENGTQTTLSLPDDNQDIYKVSEKSDDKLMSNTDSAKLGNATTSQKTKVTMKASDVKMYYKDGHKFSVTLKEKKNPIYKAKVKITINKKTYEKTTDKKGTATLDLNFKPGTYSILTKFDGTNIYESKQVKSTLTIKSTIKSNGLTKYYKNTASFYSTFYDKKGKLLKNTDVKFKLNKKTYSVKTNSKGVAKLKIDLKPGSYTVTSTNPKTTESITSKVLIKSLIETKDLTIKDGEKGKFNVKILNSNGKASPNKKVTLKVNGKTYTKTTDKKGEINLDIKLDAGSYKITTEYLGLKATNKISVNKVIKKSNFSHIIEIPNYVNVTIPKVYANSVYSLKTGFNGIVKMPKNEVFTIQIGTNTYSFSTSQTYGIGATTLDYKSYLIPFDGGQVKSDVNKSKLNGNGIILKRMTNYTQIEFRSTTSDNIELFGVYADEGFDRSETITYMQNGEIKAKVNIKTQSFDEMGLKYSLAKYYGKSIYDFNYKSYDEITSHATSLIKFVNTNKPVTFSYFGNYIVGDVSKEDIKTRFIINGVEELEKTETISYGLGEKYRNTMGFEVLQSYAIINEKVKKKTLENWVNLNSAYLNKFGIMNVYGMFLASLETVWLADELADNYSKEFNVNWKRTNTVTILGGINLEDTYLHILNADMGMSVSGNNKTNVLLFKAMNSLYLPNIESYALKEVSDTYSENITTSLDNVLSSVANNSFSIVQLGEIFYIISEDTKDSLIMINSTSGIVNALLIKDGFAYKGSSVKTSCDCCSVGWAPQNIVRGIQNTFNTIKKKGKDIINFVTKKSNALATLGFYVGSVGVAVVSKIFVSSSTLGLSSAIGMMLGIHTAGNYYKNNFVEKKDWHFAYEHVTFTRDGIMQNKKFFNIPKSDGTYDYIEVEINDDLTLNRKNALYVSNGKVTKLTKSQTYKYFDEEKYTLSNIPYKYQKHKVAV